MTHEICSSETRFSNRMVKYIVSSHVAKINRFRIASCWRNSSCILGANKLTLMMMKKPVYKVRMVCIFLFYFESILSFFSIFLFQFFFFWIKIEYINVYHRFHMNLFNKWTVIWDVLNLMQKCGKENVFVVPCRFVDRILIPTLSIAIILTNMLLPARFIMLFVERVVKDPLRLGCPD